MTISHTQPQRRQVCRGATSWTNPSTNTKKDDLKKSSWFCGSKDWLLRSLCSLRLTPFRSARRWGPYKTTLRNELLHNLFCFYMPMSANRFAPKHIKTKRCRVIDISLLRLFCGSWRIRTADPLLVRQMLWTSWAKLPLFAGAKVWSFY